MEVEVSDSQLVAQYIDGNEESLSLLILRYLKIVYRYAYSICKNQGDAEDISQVVFLKAWKNIKKYDTNQSFKTWILAITRNTTIDWLRKKKNIPFSFFEDVSGENSFVDQIPDKEILADELFFKVENAKMLKILLEKISSNQREVLELRYRDDLTFEEIGKILKKPTDTVKSLHRRALIAIRSLLSK